MNRPLVMQLARCEYVEDHENVIAIGNNGTGKTHVALGLDLVACQEGLSVGFTTAAALVNGLIEARGERRLLNLPGLLARLKLLIINEPGFVPLSHTWGGTALRGLLPALRASSILVTTNMPFDEWTQVFGSERLTGALLNRLTQHLHILEMNGDSFRLRGSEQSAAAGLAPDPRSAGQYYKDELRVEELTLSRAVGERFPSQNTLQLSDTKRQAALAKAVSTMLDQLQSRGGK